MTTETLPIIVSVVIPAYRAARYIQTALDSVLQQSFVGYEIIVVNDGSPDTESLEDALDPYFAQIRYFKKDHAGPSAARNFGIKQARGEYVAFLDSDDFWMPDHLETAMKVFRQDPSLGLVYGDSFLIRDEQPIGRTFARESQVLPVRFESLLAETCTVTTSTTVASRAALLQAGVFDERLHRCEDFDLWLRMAFRGVNMTHHPKVTACRALSGSGLSANCYRMKCDRLAVFAKTANLALSSDQRKLLAERYEKTEADANLDRFKACLHEGDFENAASAARSASKTLRGWKLRAAVSCIERVPHTLRFCYQAHQNFLAVRNRIRSAKGADATGIHLPARPVARTLARRPGWIVEGLAAGD